MQMLPREPIFNPLINSDQIPAIVLGGGELANFAHSAYEHR